MSKPVRPRLEMIINTIGGIEKLWYKSPTGIKKRCSQKVWSDSFIKIRNQVEKKIVVVNYLRMQLLKEYEEFTSVKTDL